MDYAQTVRMLVFYHKIDIIRICLQIINLKEHQNYSIFKDKKGAFSSILFYFLLLPFTNVESQIYQLQKDSIGKEKLGHCSQNWQFGLKMVENCCAENS